MKKLLIDLQNLDKVQCRGPQDQKKLLNNTKIAGIRYIAYTIIYNFTAQGHSFEFLYLVIDDMCVNNLAIAIGVIKHPILYSNFMGFSCITFLYNADQNTTSLPRQYSGFLWPAYINHWTIEYQFSAYLKILWTFVV